MTGFTLNTTPAGRTMGPVLAVTPGRVIRSEWLKLRTVRSQVLTLAAAAFVFVCLGVVISAFANGDGDGPGGSGGSLTASLSGILLAQLIIGVLGVMFVSSEYNSGMIRVTLAAVRARSWVLAGKAVAIAAAVFATMAACALVAFLVGNQVYGGPGATYSFTDLDVVRGLLGTALYAAGIGVLGVGLGFLLRSTAGAIGVLVALLLVAPLVIQLVPGSVGEWIGKLLPSNAGESFMQTSAEAGRLSGWAGLAVFGVWVLAPLVAGAIALFRRDA